ADILSTSPSILVLMSRTENSWASLRSCVRWSRKIGQPGHPRLSIVRQCALVSIGRSTFYRAPAPETAENLALMRLLDEQFLETPWYGSRQMARHLRRLGHADGRKRVRRLMATMGRADLPAATDHGSASRAPDLPV